MLRDRQTGTLISKIYPIVLTEYIQDRRTKWSSDEGMGGHKPPRLYTTTFVFLYAHDRGQWSSPGFALTEFPEFVKRAEKNKDILCVNDILVLNGKLSGKRKITIEVPGCIKKVVQLFKKII